MLCLKSSKLDRVSTGSDSDLVNPWSQATGKYRMLMTYQVATAPCTDPIQVQSFSFEAKVC
jgi:hypothetical protein